MNQNSRSSSARIIALGMIGLGFISIGIVLFVILRNYDAQLSQEFSTLPVEVEFPAPELNLTDMNGNPVSLAQYRGSVLLVNLWATWCPPCREEMPTLEAFYKKHKDDGFVLIGINQEEEKDVVAPFVKENRITFPIWLDLEYLAEQKFNTMNLPSSFVIDREGVVRLMWVGGISERNLEKYVPDIINQ